MAGNNPRSETDQLTRVEALLEDLRRFLFQGNSMMADSTLARIEIIVSRLKKQVESGYHVNPAPFRAGMVVGKIGDDVHAIRYRHAKNGHFYQHQFNGDAEVWAVQRNGKNEILLTHRNGLPLWDEFPDGRE
jgi:hypothetical protein